VEVLAKARDAALMFWQALDERERMLVLYAAGYLALLVISSSVRRSRERLKQELRDELAGGAVDGR